MRIYGIKQVVRDYGALCARTLLSYVVEDLRMSSRYQVSIPIEATVQDGVDASFTHKLEDGLMLGNILRVRIEDDITYLDIEVVAEQRNEAITSGLAIAWRFVQLISLVYDKGFEVSLAGIRAIPMTPAEPPIEIRQEGDHVRIIVRETLHISDHIRATAHISSLDQILPLWNRVNQSNSVIADGLEWLYLGAITSNDRMAFLAYWLALELLVERTSGNEQATTILKKYVPGQQDRTLLKQEMMHVLKKYINDDDAISRLMEYLEQAKVESDVDRWTRILQKSGINIQLEEVKELRKMRGAIIHQSDRSRAAALSPRLHRVVATYLDLLLRTEEKGRTSPEAN